MKENINIFELFKTQNKLTKIIIYPVILVENDPYEHTMNSTLLNPVCVKGLVRDISMGKAIWEMAGIQDIGTKEVMVERRYKDLFKNSGKITINDEDYLTYKDAAGKSLQFIEKQDYLLILLEKKNG